MKWKSTRTSTTLAVVAVVSGVLAVLPIVLDALTQEVYAPTSRRGLFKADVMQASIMKDMYPYHSAGMIVPCDDMELLQATYDKWKAVYNSNV